MNLKTVDICVCSRIGWQINFCKNFYKNTKMSELQINRDVEAEPVGTNRQHIQEIPVWQDF